MKSGEIIARKQRIWFLGATYQLMERGIRRQAIYYEDKNKIIDVKCGRIPSLTVEKGKKPHNQHKYAVCEVFLN